MRIRRSTLMKDMIRILGLTLFFVFIGYLFSTPVIKDHFINIDWLQKNIASDGAGFGRIKDELVFMLLGIVLLGLGFPRTFFAAIAGTLFGFLAGSVIALMTALVGSLLNYWLGKSILRSVIKNRFKGYYQKWKGRIREDAFWWVLVARLVPFMNGTVMNLLLGAMKTPLRPFILASILGFAPLSFVFALFGHGAANGSIVQIVIASCLLLTGQTWLVLRWKKKVPVHVDMNDGLNQTSDF